MKVTKVISFSNSFRKNITLKKSELSSLKVLETRGFIQRYPIVSGDTVTKSHSIRSPVDGLVERTSKKTHSRTLHTRLHGTHKMVFLQGKARSRDQLRTFYLPQATGFIFTTEYGRLSQKDCIKKGIGGKLIMYLVSLLFTGGFT